MNLRYSLVPTFLRMTSKNDSSGSCRSSFHTFLHRRSEPVRLSVCRFHSHVCRIGWWIWNQVSVEWNSNWRKRFKLSLNDGWGQSFSLNSKKLHKFLISHRGHVDFYPNQGRAPQPGCEKLDILTVTACSHYRAPLFFAESILMPHSFYAYQCDLSLIQLPSYRNCLNASTVALMGEHMDQKYVRFHLRVGNLISEKTISNSLQHSALRWMLLLFSLLL